MAIVGLYLWALVSLLVNDWETHAKVPPPRPPPFPTCPLFFFFVTHSLQALADRIVCDTTPGERDQIQARVIGDLEARGFEVEHGTYVYS